MTNFISTSLPPLLEVSQRINAGNKAIAFLSEAGDTSSSPHTQGHHGHTVLDTQTLLPTSGWDPGSGRHSVKERGSNIESLTWLFLLRLFLLLTHRLEKPKTFIE